MSTLRVSNIEAKADASSPTIDEKVKITNSQGRVLMQVDGVTAGITTVGINTTGNTFTVSGSNVTFSGSVTSSGVSTFSQLQVGTGGTVITTTVGGLVGVNTSNPSFTLDVFGQVRARDYIVSELNISRDSLGPYNWIDLGPSDSEATRATAAQIGDVAGAKYAIACGGFGLNFYKHVSTGSWANAFGVYATGLTDSTPYFFANNRIGIGIQNPTAELQIVKTVAGGNGALLSIQNRSSTSGTKCGIMFGVDTSDANWSDVGNGQIIMENTSGANTGQLKFRVYDGADSEAMKIAGDGSGSSRNGIAFARAGVALDNSWDGFPGIVVFNADGYGNTANRTEFRIHGFAQSYASYPGTTGADFGTNLRIDGSTYFSSDSRHKTNIVNNPYGLNEILQLQPRKFNRINSSGEIEENQGDILGFIAQEVKEVIPEAVNYYPDEDTPNEIGWCRAYALSDGYILSTLVNAVKEQNAIIETLKSKIEVLESQINT